MWEPPAQLVVSWRINDWQFDPEPAHGSEYEVRFTPETPTRTRVEFGHHHFERHSAGSQKMHYAVTTGWVKLLTAYAQTAKTA